MADRLRLKWGTVQGCDLKSDKSREAAQKYADLGMSASVMTPCDTPEQKQALCDLIDAIDGEIVNDWSGEVMTKAAAKEYIMTYGKR